LTAADPVSLVTFLASHERNAIDVSGFDTLHGFVENGAGTITLQILELISYEDAAGADQRVLVQRGSNVGPLSDGDSFELDTPGGGRWLLRADAVVTGPCSVYLAGGAKANEGSI
jgi:hypothetical protein